MARKGTLSRRATTRVKRRGLSHNQYDTPTRALGVVSARLASRHVFHGHACASLHVERSGHPPPLSLFSASPRASPFSRADANPGGG